MIPTDTDAIRQAAVATLLYFDIFDHPLTVDETFAFLPRNSITLDEFRAAIEDAPGIDRITAGATPYLTVAGRPRAWIGARGEKERRAERLLSRAGWVARLLAAFPFVRAVMISGSLSKRVADRKADVDWFIITEPGRLWICKTILTLFRRTILFNRTKYFCTNYYLAADALELPDRNVFIATEIATAMPAVNEELCARFFAANGWIREFLPNVPRPVGRCVPESAARVLRRAGEWIFRGRAGDALERRCHDVHTRYERRRFPVVSEAAFEEMFRSGPGECKIHRRNFQRRVLDAYDERLRVFGIRRP